MTKTLLPILFCLSFVMPAATQTRMFVPNGCGVKTNEMGKDRYVFDPSSEAVQLIKIIMDANFLKSNFEIKASDVQNAIATVDHGKRFIIYNTLFIEQIQNNSGSEGAALYVFAHEIAHHLNNHFFDLNDPVKQKEQELEADLFAGAMMYRLGYSMEEAKSGVDIVCNERESETHPPRSARVAAVTSGWKKAREQSNDVLPNKVSLQSMENTAPPDNMASEMPDNMVMIPGGTFKMGSNDGIRDEKPTHSVTVSSFYLSKFEVTVAEFRAFKEDSGYQTDAEKQANSYGYEENTLKLISDRNWQHDPEGNTASNNHPVIYVSWNDAIAYCIWLSNKFGKTYRLPSEAEWEYAAGNGKQHTKYSWGNSDPSEKKGGNVADESGAGQFKWTKQSYNIFQKFNDHNSTTASVGSFDANTFGLFDMTGNVSEWCNDRYSAFYYPSSPKINPTGADESSDRVVRGGSWLSNSERARIMARDYNDPSHSNCIIGFRIARTL